MKHNLSDKTTPELLQLKASWIGFRACEWILAIQSWMTCLGSMESKLLWIIKQLGICP